MNTELKDLEKITPKKVSDKKKSPNINTVNKSPSKKNNKNYIPMNQQQFTYMKATNTNTFLKLLRLLSYNYNVLWLTLVLENAKFTQYMNHLNESLNKDSKISLFRFIHILSFHSSAVNLTKIEKKCSI